jgi:hypothetical protein
MIPGEKAGQERRTGENGRSHPAGQAARARECWVQHLGPVGRRQQQHARAALQHSAPSHQNKPATGGSLAGSARFGAQRL